ncbi:MAG: T9SS type A sorting domain-containing protein [Bacteroidales bacterium]|nr:T9SS type A sorting domain-containing protein [Bacteroidales bacterium]MCF8406077.1 T9SS type A sorting domain-containing protein [Bacteroidales bacterium]
MRKLLLIGLIISFCLRGFALNFYENNSDTTDYLYSSSWDNKLLWNLNYPTGSSATVDNFNGINNDGISVSFSFPASGGWFDLSKTVEESYDLNKPMVFFVKSTSTDILELKFTDIDGSVFGVKTNLIDYNDEWKHIVVYLENTSYWWGGDSKFDKISKFSVAVSGNGSGYLWLDEIGIGKEGLQTSFPSTYDPDSTLSGIGFAQRRDASMVEEDSLVLEYLKVLQDVSSPARQIIPSMEGDQAQTFNNSLAAMVFIIKNEKERAERVLDFYAGATDINNNDIRLQNFYYNGEARGFYQHVSLTSYRDEGGNTDRWMGDMAWLLIACKNYEFEYESDRYANLISILKDLLLSFYVDAAHGGYIRHGWRKGDTYLHEDSGHPEGNIDCYVALELCGEHFYAQKIRTWLDYELNGKKELPLDLYTWRVLAFGTEYSPLLNIPEYDFRYRKILEVNGENVMGFWHSPDMYANNFWNDGTGHIACAYLNFGEKERGYFYANQMDKLIVDRNIGGVTTHAIPYSLNHSANQAWVDTTKGFLSSTAWYIFAKNGYNPFQTERFTISTPYFEEMNRAAASIFPNPASDKITIMFPGMQGISIINIYGQLVRRFTFPSSENTDIQISDLETGIYFIIIETPGERLTSLFEKK